MTAIAKKVQLRVVGPAGVVATRKTHRPYTHVLFGYSSAELRARRAELVAEEGRALRAQQPEHADAYDRWIEDSIERAAEERAAGDFWTEISWHSTYDLALKGLEAARYRSFILFEIVPVEGS